MFKLARTYDELNKYKKKRFCVTGTLFVLAFTRLMRLLVQIHSFHSSSLPDYFPRSLARSHLVDYYFLSLLSSSL